MRINGSKNMNESFVNGFNCSTFNNTECNAVILRLNERKSSIYYELYV